MARWREGRTAGWAVLRCHRAERRAFKEAVALTLAERAHRGVTLAPTMVEDTIERNIRAVAGPRGDRRDRVSIRVAEPSVANWECVSVLWLRSAYRLARSGTRRQT